MEQKMPAPIESVTLTSATYSGVTFNPTFINFFYGKNGAGKTSLGLEITEGSGVKWTEGENPASYEILLYNQDFIDRHFRTLDKLQGVFSLSDGKETEETEKKIKAYGEQKRALEKRLYEISGDSGEKAKISQTLQTIETNYQGACLRNTKELREKYKLAFKGATRNPQLAQKISNTAPREVNEEELEKLYEIAFSREAKEYPYLVEIGSGDLIDNIPTCDLMTEVIVSKGDTVYANLVGQLHSLEWIEEGHKRFHNDAGGLCPYCQQVLPGNFEALLASCYDEEYQKKIAKITAFRDSYFQHMNSIYQVIEHNQSLEMLPAVAQHMDELKPKIENFLRAMRSVIVQIDNKLKSPSTSIELEDVTGLIRDIDKAFTQANIYIKHNNDVVAKLSESREQCIKDVWALTAYHVLGELQTYHLSRGEAERTNSKLDSEITKIQSELKTIDSALAGLSTASTTIQAAIIDINRLLRDSGFEGFEIEKSDMTPNAYKVVRKNKEKAVAVRLSDGEKHFLSFLYFYNLVKGCQENGVMKDKIVIIDDPVSSLDGNALFIVSSIVREMIEICYNNTDYRDHQVKGDYIKQLFILTHNAQFHRGITYNQVNRFKSVNFYKINKVDNASTITPCIRPSRTQAGEDENYNPVKNAYAALWTEYQELNSEIPLMNVIHRILDFYFLDMCGRDGLSVREEVLVKNREKFIGTKEDGTPDMTLFTLADSMLQYMGAGFDGDMSLVNDYTDVEQIRKTFEMIFDRLGQGQHYRMMMERSKDAVVPNKEEIIAAATPKGHK